MSHLRHTSEHELVSIASPSDDFQDTENPAADDDDDGFDLSLDSHALESQQLQHEIERRSSIEEDELAIQADQEKADADEATLNCQNWIRNMIQASMAAVGVLVVISLIIIVYAKIRGSGGGSNDDDSLATVSFPPLHSSPYDTRSYRSFLLTSNSLSVLCIHDPTSDYASASMSVGVGSSSDFTNRSGLAHFLEHMLFLGSELFPEEDEYNRLLHSYGGAANAYTAEDETNYFFNVQSTPQGTLDQVLQRFSGFFTSPLLKSDSAYREMNQVESEHRKNILNDDWRRFHLLHELASPEAAFHHFSTGTIVSLNHTDIVSDLRTFHSEYYVAQNMNLVIQGRESLEELEELVKKYFSDVKGVKYVNQVVDTCKEQEKERQKGEDDKKEKRNSDKELSDHSLQRQKNRAFEFDTTSTATSTCIPPAPTPRTRFTPSSPSFSFNTLSAFSTSSSISRNITYLPITQSSHVLSLYFPLPSLKSEQSLEQDGYSYVAYMLGHEGSSSTVCTLLKQLNLVTSISVGLTLNSIQMNSTVLAVECILTEKGNVWEERMKVVKMVMEYVELLKKLPLLATSTDPSTPSPSHQQYWQTMHSEFSIRWTYADSESPEKYTSSLAARMTQWDELEREKEGRNSTYRENLLLPPSMYSFGDGSTIPLLLSALTHTNLLLLYSSSSLVGNSTEAKGLRDSIAPEGEWKVERWYEIVYYEQPLLTDDFIKMMTTPPPTTDPSQPHLSLSPLINPYLPKTETLIDWKLFNTTELQKEAYETFSPSRDQPISLPLTQSDNITPSTNRLFYKPAILFSIPRTFVGAFIEFVPGFLEEDEKKDGAAESTTAAAKQVQLLLYRVLLSELLTSFQYQLSLVGYSLGVDTHPSRLGLVVTVSGLSSGLPDVWKELLKRLSLDSLLTELTADRFNILKKEYFLSSFSSYPTTIMPYQYGFYQMRMWQERKKVAIEVLEKTYNDVILSSSYTRENLQAFTQKMLQKTGVTIYVYGNSKAKEAREYYKSYLEVMASPTNQQPRLLELTQAELTQIDEENKKAQFLFNTVHVNATTNSAVTVPASSYVFPHTVLNPQETNSALIYSLQVTSSSSSDEAIKSTLLLQILSSFLSTSVFNVLRTQKTLGYIVSSHIRESQIGQGDHIQIGWEIVIQSDLYDPVKLETSVEEYLNEIYTSSVKTISDTDFNQQIATLNTSLIQSLHGSLLSPSANFLSIWIDKIIRDVDTESFEREEKMMRVLGDVKKEEVVELFEKKFLSPSTRRKFVVAIYGSQFPINNTSLAAPDNVYLNEADRVHREDVLKWSLGA